MISKQPLHCDHECVCPDFKASTSEEEPDPCTLPCMQHSNPIDTRRYKIVESVPDKEGIVLIAIKEDPNGQFVSRDAALEYMQIMQSIRGFPASDDALELLRALEWSGNLTDYEDSWGMITIACPSCHNAKKDGHKPGCKLSNIITHREEKP